eukprot:TRINITY_DN9042_c3_g1_i1.p1 TRINITY_DN9042_c3_g1~~TRINITY_DN9042_c3_g1_i1.p1  ORF type:complete len:328 (-),score=54.57 TRINITY_DN9042_c3_g1_i1:31-987(-)
MADASTDPVDDVKPVHAKKKADVPFASKLVVGGIAGVVATSIIFPIDIVKTRLQNQVVGANGERKYKGAWDCFRKTVRAEGYRGLYRGLAPNLVGVTPEKAIKLAVNDEMRRRLEDENGYLSVPRQILAGATAGFCQVSATNPMEIVKIRLQLQGASDLPPEQRKSAVGVVRDLGLRGLYKGSASTFLRDVPFSIIFFPSVAGMKTMLTKEGETECSFERLFIGSCVAGGVAAGMVTPADVIKTRLQAGTRNYGGLIDCVRKIYAEEGFAAFWKGAPQRMAVIAPLFGIALLAFEMQKWYLLSDSTSTAKPATKTQSK